MNSSQLLRFIRLGLITVFGFFISLLGTILLLPLFSFFWVVSKTMYFFIGLKLGNNFTRPTGLDIIQGMESDRSRPFINSIGRFEGKVDIDQFCNRFDREIIKLKDKHGKLRYKKFTQTYEKVYGYHVFRDVEDFDIRNQIRKVDVKDFLPDKLSNPMNGLNGNKNFFEGVAPPVFSADGKESAECGKGSTDCPTFPNVEWEILVEKAMEKYGARKIPTGKPQWEILLIEEPKHYTMIFRMHHSYCDGVYFLRFLLQHVGDEPVECTLPYNYHQPSHVRRIFDCFWAFCLIPYGLFRLSFSYEKNPLHGPKLSGDKMFLTSKPIPLETLKLVKKESNTSMNAIFFTCLSNAVANHFRKKKSSVENVILMIPVSLQDLERPIKLKNRFALIGILLPTFISQNVANGQFRNPTSALERLQEVQESCNRSRDDPSFLAIHMLLVFICSLLPSDLLNAMFTSRGITSSMSNVVGPQNDEFRFTGARKTEILFWIPDRSPLGMGVSVIGFAGKVRVGLMIDRVLMSTPQEGYEFLDSFVEEVQNLHTEVLPPKKGGKHRSNNNDDITEEATRLVIKDIP